MIGSAVFGVGWGLAGICPGPGLVGITMGDPRFTLWMLSCLGGMSLWNRLRGNGMFRERLWIKFGPPKSAPAA